MISNVAGILGGNRGPVTTGYLTDTLGSVVKKLKKGNIGLLPIVHKDGTVATVVSERDIVRLLADDSYNPELQVKDTPGLPKRIRYVNLSTTLLEAATRMENHNIRHLPVINPKTRVLIGIISIKDVSRAMHENFDEESQTTLRYIQGNHDARVTV